MRLSTWHRTFQTWVQDLLLTSEWGVELPELDSSTRAHLPPFTNISYEPRGNRLTYFSLEQQLFHYQRLPYNLLYEQISLDDIEGFYGTISYSLANRWGEISDEIEKVNLKPQDEPIIIREIGDNRGYWFVQLSWTFDMTAELEPEEPDDTYLNVDFGVNYKLWTVQKLDSSDLLPRFPDFPADLPGIITIQLTPSVVYQVTPSPRTTRTSSVIANVNLNITSPATYITQVSPLIEFITANGRTANALSAALIDLLHSFVGTRLVLADTSSTITWEVAASAGNNTRTNLLLEWSLLSDTHLIAYAQAIPVLDLVVTSSPTVTQDQASAFTGNITFTVSTTPTYSLSEQLSIVLSTTDSTYLTKSGSLSDPSIVLSTTNSTYLTKSGSLSDPSIVLSTIDSTYLTRAGSAGDINVLLTVTATGSIATTNAPKIFDSYPNPTGWGAAFTKLSSTYTGNCCKVRNSVSLNEYTIGFTGDVVDEAALLAAYEGNNAALLYLIEWYDQTGNDLVGIAVEDLTDPSQSFPPIVGELNQTLVKFDGEQYLKFTGTPPSAFKTMWTGTDKLASLSFYGRVQYFDNSNDYTFYIYHRNLNNSFARLFFGTDSSGSWFGRQSRSGIKNFNFNNDELFHNFCWVSDVGRLDIYIDNVSVGGTNVNSTISDNENDYTLNASFGAAANASNQGATGGQFFNETAIRYTKYHIIYDTADNVTDITAKNAILNP